MQGFFGPTNSDPLALPAYFSKQSANVGPLVWGVEMKIHLHHYFLALAC
jgi:hypothetical protein